MSIKWTRPSGLEIETNDRPETIETAEKLGWQRVVEKPKPKRTRKAKEDGRNS